MEKIVNKPDSLCSAQISVAKRGDVTNTAILEIKLLFAFKKSQKCDGEKTGR